jgi:hypothetical protein
MERAYQAGVRSALRELQRQSVSDCQADRDRV